MLEKQPATENNTVPLIPMAPKNSAWKNIRLLMAEDDTINQAVTRHFLTSLGYAVDIAGNGREAIRLLSENDYPLVLMDCQMPEMGGLEATAIIRDPGSSVRNHAIPIIALTASDFTDDRNRLLAAGMNDYLAKPLHIETLAEVLDKWIVIPTTIDLPVFDESSLLKRHGGNTILAREIALLFTQKAPEYLAEIQKHLNQNHVPGVQYQAHKLKGSAATLGADRLSAVAAELVILAEHNQLDKAGRTMQQLAEEFERLLTGLAERGWILPV